MYNKSEKLDPTANISIFKCQTSANRGDEAFWTDGMIKVRSPGRDPELTDARLRRVSESGAKIRS